MNTVAGDRPASRLASIDAYRGLVILLMMAEVLSYCAISQAVPDSGFWKFLCYHQSHVQWVGCSLHDLIQPGFSFLVGVVLPFSIASRLMRGATTATLVRHAAIRSVILIVLGIAIGSLPMLPSLNVQFEDTLAQIGLAYVFLFPIGFCRARYLWIPLSIILIGYWLLFALYPVPGPDFDYTQVGVSNEWLAENGLKGFAAHWQINSNPAALFDQWFVSLFREHPYVPFKGLTTLNFVPLIGTMILGLMAGHVLRSDRRPWEKVRWLVVAGLVCLVSGWGLGALGICPVVKSIWTPSWVLFSGGWCFLFMAAAFILVDLRGQRKLAFPLIVVGMNSIVAYCLYHVFQRYASNSFRRISGETFKIFGDAYEPLVNGIMVLLFLWFILYVMYRLKIFVRI
ncbi:MAG TPA: DUF5009 domain-containing protein [Chthoniobacterales bacterium]|nr:DUF5009 domain-containing protein [Chthoniobacterales bacterium]